MSTIPDVPFSRLPPELILKTLNIAAASNKETALLLCRVSSWVWDVATPHLLDTVILDSGRHTRAFLTCVTRKPESNPWLRHIGSSLRALAMYASARNDPRFAYSKADSLERCVVEHSKVVKMATSLKHLSGTPSMLYSLLIHSDKPFEAYGVGKPSRPKEFHLSLIGEDDSGKHVLLFMRLGRSPSQYVLSFFESVTHLILGPRATQEYLSFDLIAEFFPSLTHLFVDGTVMMYSTNKHFRQLFATYSDKLSSSDTLQMIVYPIPPRRVEESSTIHLNAVADTIEREERSWFLSIGDRNTIAVWRMDITLEGPDMWEQAIEDTGRIFDMQTSFNYE